MKRLFTLILLLLLSWSVSARAQISRLKEYPLPPGVTILEVTSFQGTIQWLPVDSQEKSRIYVEVVADGVSQMGVRKALTQVRIVDNISPSSLLLEARSPALPPGVDYIEVNYFIHALPGQFYQFKAKTSRGPIEIRSAFQGALTIINSNAPIVIHSGRGLVSLQTENAAIELGEITLTNSSRVQTSEGPITGTVTLPLQGTFSFSTRNAPIDLKMPAETVGTFHLSTPLGTVDFHLGEDIESGRSAVTIRRTENPVVNITTANSSITISEIE